MSTWWMLSYRDEKAVPCQFEVRMETDTRVYFEGPGPWGTKFASKRTGTEMWFRSREEAIKFALDFWRRRLLKAEAAQKHFLQLMGEGLNPTMRIGSLPPSPNEGGDQGGERTTGPRT